MGYSSGQLFDMADDYKEGGQFRHRALQLCNVCQGKWEGTCLEGSSPAFVTLSRFESRMLELLFSLLSPSSFH
eukprot:3688011-Amphidinium_carterae.2